MEDKQLQPQANKVIENLLEEVARLTNENAQYKALLQQLLDESQKNDRGVSE
ncbi:hypothetical protein MUA90_10695 [Staphylococcus sp. IVB6181]|uniref:hypothetical protein n=1 Tax=Staphylococcus sp. IVB6181 TaxID=2929481 RepID=UPI0021D3604C|nr:hypothetical protein [Staphylococcus sp. IVB6181]UXV34484.1 hypothetical protein MUA90_10695 [Staphylococcus sp. IVB6181]